ncbi:cytochrome b/b6 domain-containing protein [Burkholderia cenocepacia]|nr:cytochrome b/b6 domain-containing protein [Burkholderia cenocepacia]
MVRLPSSQKPPPDKAGVFALARQKCVRCTWHGPHRVLNALMVTMPLIGWAMLTARGYSVTFVWLRGAHRVLAYQFFATFLAHFAAALYHWLIRRDGVVGRWMAGS